MWGIIAAILVVIAIWLLWRVIKSEPATAEPPETVNVREPVPKRPLNRSGAVAVEEPDEG
jgi:hypothetical protein